MNHRPPRPNSDGLDATREAMRRDLHRANTAVGVILIVVLALAVAAVIAGMRAAKNKRKLRVANGSGIPTRPSPAPCD
jgi:hypothetical protein